MHSVHDFPDVYNAIPWISLRWVAGASARLSRPPRRAKIHSHFWCEQNFLADPYLIARRGKEAADAADPIPRCEKKAIFLPCHASCQAHLEAARPRELTNELTTAHRRTSWRRSRRRRARLTAFPAPAPSGSGDLRDGPEALFAMGAPWAIPTVECPEVAYFPPFDRALPSPCLATHWHYPCLSFCLSFDAFSPCVQVAQAAADGFLLALRGQGHAAAGGAQVEPGFLHPLHALLFCDVSLTTAYLLRRLAHEDAHAHGRQHIGYRCGLLHSLAATRRLWCRYGFVIFTHPDVFLMAPAPALLEAAIASAPPGVAIAGDADEDASVHACGGTSNLGEP